MMRLFRRLRGYRIGRRATVGVSVLAAREVILGDGVRMGHLNAVVRVNRLEAGSPVRIGALDIIRGGERVSLGDQGVKSRTRPQPTASVHGSVAC